MLKQYQNAKRVGFRLWGERRGVVVGWGEVRRGRGREGGVAKRRQPLEFREAGRGILIWTRVMDLFDLFWLMSLEISL